MSRRKQAFPVRIEGSGLHLLAEPGSSCSQKSIECSSSRTILLDECNFSIPAEAAAHLRPPNILSNGEFIAADAAYNESETNVLSHAESFLKEESKTQVILPSVKIELPIVLNEDQDPLIISPCSNSSFIGKEDICTFPVDEKTQSESVIHDQELKPLCLLHNHTHCGCIKAEKNVEICRDLNVRTSLVCRTGTEIKIIQNASAEKVEVHCVTDATKNAFGVHHKQVEQVRGSVHENHTPEAENQRPVFTEEENLLESEESPLEILPCVEVNLCEGPEPLIISPCADSIPIIQETSLSAFSVGETEQCTRLITTPEPDSSTILLDEYDLNIPASAVYNEPKTCMLTSCDEPNFLKSETNPQILLPSAEIEPAEPSIILSEEQDSLVIAASSSCIVKKEGFCAFGVSEPKQCQNVINQLVEGDEMCGDLNIRNSLIGKDGIESETVHSSCVEKEEEQSVTRFTENTVKVGKKQRLKSRRSARKNHAPEAVELSQACTEHENPLDIQDSPLEAILPCVDVDPSLLKEEPEPFLISSCEDSIPILKETSFSAFPVGHSKEIERDVETSVDLDVVASLMCETETETESLCPEKGVGKSKKPTRKSSRVRKKRFQKVRRSPRNAHASKSTRQTRASAERKKFVKSEFAPEAILPCVDVDPSLLKEEPEPLITSSCKDSIPTASKKSLFSFPTREGSRCESKSNTQKIIQMCLQSENSETSDDSSVNNFDSCIPGSDTSRKLKPCLTDEEIRCMVDFTKESLDEREKKLQQIREAVYRKRSLETDDQRQARLEKDKLRQRKRRAEETEEQREKRLLTMRLHKRIKRSMHSSAGLQKNFLDYYMEEMFKYPETQEEQGSPLNMIVSIDPSWVLRTVEKQQFKCAVETEEQRKTRLEKDMLRQRKKRAEETADQRAKRLETMRINKRIRRAMETEEQRHRRLEYSRERQLFRRLNETEEQRKDRLEREKLRQRVKRASESSEERALRLQAARERMRMRLSDPGKVTDMFDLLSSDSLSS